MLNLIPFLVLKFLPKKTKEPISLDISCGSDRDSVMKLQMVKGELLSHGIFFKK
jgi:hypothetical protein